MLRLNKFYLVSYASGFVSFILKSRELDKTKLEEIILFGSVARGDFTEKSDIDLFVNTKNEEIERILRSLLDKFYKSKTGQDYLLRGIKNEIKLSVGDLNKWKLKRSVINDGIQLYGRYKEMPRDIDHYYLFVFEPIKDITKRNRIIRKLFGRNETNKGLSEKFHIKKISDKSFVIQVSNSQTIIDLFRKEKVNYKIFEIWSDSF